MTSLSLSYYFNPQSSFYYTSDGTRILNGDVIQITMPNNNTSQSVFTLVDGKSKHFYTLNSMYITLSVNSYYGKYFLILQGNKNDHASNAKEQILIMLPVYDDVKNTMEGTVNSITRLNNLYIDSLLRNMELDATYNFSYGTNSSTIDMNNFIVDTSVAYYFPKIVNSNINYNIIFLTKSNLYFNPLPSKSLLGSLIKPMDVSSLLGNNIIEIRNNGGPITSTTETDIYIDCSPTNNIGEKVDIYTSKDMDQLKFFKINDLKVWAFRFITIFVIILIIFIIIKIFQISGSESGNESKPGDSVSGEKGG